MLNSSIMEGGRTAGLVSLLWARLPVALGDILVAHGV